MLASIEPFLAGVSTFDASRPQTVRAMEKSFDEHPFATPRRLRWSYKQFHSLKRSSLSSPTAFPKGVCASRQFICCQQTGSERCRSEPSSWVVWMDRCWDGLASTNAADRRTTPLSDACREQTILRGHHFGTKLAQRTPLSAIHRISLVRFGVFGDGTGVIPSGTCVDYPTAPNHKRRSSSSRFSPPLCSHLLIPPSSLVRASIAQSSRRRAT